MYYCNAVDVYCNDITFFIGDGEPIPNPDPIYKTTMSNVKSKTGFIKSIVNKLFTSTDASIEVKSIPASTEVTAQLLIDPDISVPYLDIVSPNTFIVRRKFLIKAISLDENLKDIKLYFGSDLVATSNNSPAKAVINSKKYKPGYYIIKAEAEDTSGNKTTKEMTVRVDKK
jgi:hypothetical protein